MTRGQRLCHVHLALDKPRARGDEHAEEHDTSDLHLVPSRLEYSVSVRVEDLEGESCAAHDARGISYQGD
eukprot:1702745-Prymnesium_polylepis.1